MTNAKKILTDVIVDTLDELGASESRPIHNSEFVHVVEARWKALGHVLDPNEDFRNSIASDMHRGCPECSEWKKRAEIARENQRLLPVKIFNRHGEGYWSVRDDYDRTPCEVRHEIEREALRIARESLREHCKKIGKKLTKSEINAKAVALLDKNPKIWTLAKERVAEMTKLAAAEESV